jgi:hypothetical protein
MMKQQNETRRDSLEQQMADKEYRSVYTEQHCRQMLALQMRCMRGAQTQAVFAKRLGMSQTMINRLENPLYRGWSLRLIFQIASRLDIAAFVGFMDFGQFIRASDRLGPTVTKPRPWPAGIRKP